MNKAIKNIILLLPLLLTACSSSFTMIERSQYEASDSAFIAYLDGKDIEITNGNSVEFLNGGAEKFPRLFEDIRAAKDHIHLEYFNFRNDSINELLLGLLAEKAKEGVEVRALFDAFGNMSNNKPLKNKDLEEIRATGIKIEKFDPIEFPWINHATSRDHRKIVVIDGKIGYTGGINIADYYVDGLKGIGKWRDMHARVEGEAASELQKIFIEMWEEETGEKIAGNRYFPTHIKNDSVKIAVIDRWPHRTPESVRHAYTNAINAAKDSIVLVNPYFIPTPMIYEALEKALNDGVKVEIMVSSKSDIPFVPEGIFHMVNKLRKKGAIIYLYNEGFNHSKIMGIDGKFCTVGSTNLNSRSLRYDYETNIFIFDEEETKKMWKVIERDKKESILFDDKWWESRTCWQKFVGRIAYMIRGFL